MNTYFCEQFDFAGHTATVIRPENPNGEWIWKTEFFYAFDTAEDAACKEGYTRVYYGLSDMYGAPEAIALMSDFCDAVVEKYRLHPKCHLAGFSRGALYAFNYALARPETVASVYLDAPVLDVTAWPGVSGDTKESREMLALFGASSDAAAKNPSNPVNRFGEFAAHGFPLLLIAGDADTVVPFDKCGKKFAAFLDGAGVPYTMIVKPGVDHHPHSLENPAPILDFWRAHASGEERVKVTFRIGEKTVEQTVTFGETPAAPTDVPDGFTVAGWDTEITPATCDKTYVAILTRGDGATPTRLYEAYRHRLISHRFADAKTGAVAHTNPTEYWNAATAAFTLALEEYENPQAGPVRDRLVEQINRITFGGQSPVVDCLPMWHTPALTGALALAKKTPTVWSALPAGSEERIDWIFRAYIANASFGNADWNDFNTGPGLFGDYRRDWNVNYALGSIMPMVHATIYFGSSEKVNEIIKSFDFDTYIAHFEKYDFRQILAVWTRTRDKTRALMMDGAECDLLRASPSGSTSGRGLGVRPLEPYREFVYHGMTLTQLDKIFEYNLKYCFSGGPVTKDGSQGRGWILKDGDGDPMLGREGMIVELNQPSRSSLTYSLKDFDMMAVELALLDALGIWKPAEHPDLMALAEVGMNDFIYKANRGYHSWAAATCKQGSDDCENAYGGYYFARSIWMNRYDSTMADYLPGAVL